MMRLLHPVLAIARRDYVAIVWSRSFLVFLLGPVLPLLVALLIAPATDRRQPAVRLDTDRATTAALLAARETVSRETRAGGIPRLATDAPDLVRLTGTVGRLTLRGPEREVRAYALPLTLIAARAAAGAPAPLRIVSDRTQAGATDTAQIAQIALFILTLLLASLMVSNLVEERSGKVIELLAAAVPVEAIFLGKLAGMLAASLSGIVAWGAAALAGAWAFLPPGALPPPAVGWPAFAVLMPVYFVASFLLWGAAYLAVGAQAGSAREAQSYALPFTAAQAAALALASAAVDGEPTRTLLAELLPWTSPMTMAARAALEPELWPHLLALAGQAAAIAISVRLGARLFRTNILQGGGARRGWRRFFARGE